VFTKQHKKFQRDWQRTEVPGTKHMSDDSEQMGLSRHVSVP